MDSYLNAVELAKSQGQITESAAKNIADWLSQPRYSEYRPELLAHIQRADWKKLDDAFWTIIPFGTGGRRGRMYPIGSNAINDRTIGESAQGLADYILGQANSGNLSCAIAYDTRHRSRHFAELCASIMVANGFQVIFLDGYRATPQLSYAVRLFGCSCGIMVTASHNPPSDNAVKVYWSTGGQVLPPHDEEIIERVMHCEQIRRVDFQQAVAQGNVKFVTQEVDEKFQQAALKFAWNGSRDAKIVYSPLHGVGGFVVPSLLRAAGFANVLEYGPHSTPDGDFPNVPGHVSNPENPAVFDAIVEYAKSIGADIALATDPDCDRMGCSCPLTLDPDSSWATINGNQLGVLLTDYVISKRKAMGDLPKDAYVIKTLVTTEMTRRVAESYGVRCEGNIHVGFKWIAGLIDNCGPEGFVFGTEESHGYLIGTYARDKDGAVACLLMAQLAADLKAAGKTLHQRLDELMIQHGVYIEDLINVQMEGSQGMADMKNLMAKLRSSPPESIAGLKVLAVRDYASLVRKTSQGVSEAMQAPKSNMLILELGDSEGSPSGNAIALRPSGTEPKIKFYLFGHELLKTASTEALTQAKKKVTERLHAIKKELASVAVRG
ncbi:MAG: phospho-sugar mutase [Planctomycetota bacterium]|jgi:phosphoglucomutase/phosphomannomutase